MTGAVTPMTRPDRESLLKIARQRERLAKAEAKERAAHLVADFEMQLDRDFAFDDSEVWRAAALAAQKAADEANAAIAAECERLGIPREFRPSIASGWVGRGQNATKERRAELRRIAARQIEASEKSARVVIERQSLEIQERIIVAGLTSDEAREVLEAMPRVSDLMPELTVGKVAGLIGKGGAA